MKKSLLTLLACAACFCAFAHEDGDDVPIYEGAWNVRFDGHRSARFVLRDWNGTWQEAGPAVAAACRGKKLPVTVQESTVQGFEFTVWGSSASPECPDTAFTFKPVKDGLLEGSSVADAHVVMTRAKK